MDDAGPKGGSAEPRRSFVRMHARVLHAMMPKTAPLANHMPPRTPCPSYRPQSHVHHMHGMKWSHMPPRTPIIIPVVTRQHRFEDVGQRAAFRRQRGTASTMRTAASSRPSTTRDAKRVPGQSSKLAGGQAPKSASERRRGAIDSLRARGRAVAWLGGGLVVGPWLDSAGRLSLTSRLQTLLDSAARAPAHVHRSRYHWRVCTG